MSCLDANGNYFLYANRKLQLHVGYMSLFRFTDHCRSSTSVAETSINFALD